MDVEVHNVHREQISLLTLCALPKAFERVSVAPRESEITYAWDFRIRENDHHSN